MEISELNALIIESAKLPTQGTIIQRTYLEVLRGTLSTIRPIKVLTGLRRSGKSVILKQLYQQLRESGIPPENILFLNFESDLARPVRNVDGLRMAYELFMSHCNSGFLSYVFFDEIQVVEDWHLFVRSIYDAGRSNIFITGSNGDLLSSEIASVLGGRIFEQFILPFDLTELLKVRGVAHDTGFAQAENSAAIEQIFEQYLGFGGISETHELADDQRIAYRSSLIEKIVINDIILRFKIEYPELIRQLLEILERSLTGIISAASLGRVAKKSDQTIRAYLNYICSTFLAAELEKYNFKAKQLLASQSKFYFLDNLFSLRANRSGQLENVVFVHFVRQHGLQNVHFARDERGHEVDFVVINPALKRKIAVQVCWELTPQNLSRETNSLKLLKEYSDPDEYVYALIVRRMSLTLEQVPHFITLVEIKDELLNRRIATLAGETQQQE